MTNPFDNSQSQSPPRGFGQNPHHVQPGHNQAPPGFNGQGQGMPQPPQKKPGSKKVLWIVLAIILGLILVTGLALVAAFSAFKDFAAGLEDGPGEVAASDAGYWERTIDVDDVDAIRESEVPASVPTPLAELTSECYEDTSYFGESADQGYDAQWVPTISCLYGADGEFVAQYTENQEAIRDAERVGLQESVVDYTSARGSQIAIFGQDEEFVMVEVLEGRNAVIEYVMGGYDPDEVVTNYGDLASYLVQAGILDETPGPPPVDA
ncbi:MULTISPECIES: hypothetical protein [unclassified Corynebacterium]|uniref:hypothetical protein n=1 Tax=unclassified Corynebacterium TaxID=2624378 RepID=UPI001E5081BD|nr:MULTISPECIES: hypothetical protein [unclassified Corynebacterium]